MVYREPTAGGTAFSKRHLKMARELATKRKGGIRRATEEAIQSAYIQRFGVARYEKRYGLPLGR